MSRLKVLVVALGLLFACQRAEAQSWEVSAFGGYTPAVDIDRRAPDLNQLDVSGAFTWGVQAARLFTTALGRRGAVDAAAVGTRRRNRHVRCVRLFHHDGQTTAGQRAL